MHTIYQNRPGLELGRRIKWTVTGLTDMFVIWHDRMRQRAVLRDFDDHRLRDIGLTRAQALKEARKPFWRS